MPHPLNILFEDNHLLVVNKPAGVVTQGALAGEASVVELAKEYLRRKYSKPGNVFLGIVSRLDSPTTGVLVLARTSKAAARLSAAFRTRDVQKEYLALVEGQVAPREGTLVNDLVKDETQKRMRVVPRAASHSQQAVLRYRAIEHRAATTLVGVELDTGRKHQIRVQMAELGHPVVGDRKYGSTHKFAVGIALHAQRLTLPHPVGGQPLSFAAPLPNCWPAWCRDAVGS